MKHGSTLQTCFITCYDFSLVKVTKNIGKQNIEIMYLRLTVDLMGDFLWLVVFRNKVKNLIKKYFVGESGSP